jgi:FkbM family methyltransferase
MRTKREWFGSGPVPVLAQNGKQLKITSVPDNYLSFKLFWLGMEYYEPETVILLNELLAEGSTFFDIGANIGYYSLQVGVCRPDVRVVAFEPHPRLFALLSSNVKANNFALVNCEAKAVSSTRGTATLHLSASDMSSSLEQDFSHLRNEQVVEVPVESIDLYIEDQGISGPIVMKIDVEGHEQQALEGMMKTLATIKPDLLLEVAEPFESDPYPMLKELGYRYYQVSELGLAAVEKLEPTIHGNIWFSNYLFSARPQDEIEKLSAALKQKVGSLDFSETSCLVDAAKIERLTRVRTEA